MTHIGASLVGLWPPAPPDLANDLEKWFAGNGERCEVIELDLAGRIADGPIDDYLTRERRVDLGAASRWLMAALGDLCDPTGDGGPAFARTTSAWLDEHDMHIAELAAAGRVGDPDDLRAGESAELAAHVRATIAALESVLPGLTADPAPSA